MATTVKELLSAANSSVPRLSIQEAADKLKERNVLIVDVRDPSEVEKTGKLKGAVNVSRGMLEFRADSESQYHNSAFEKDKTVLVYCGTGGRAALAGKTLHEMGYGQVYNLGAFRDLADAGYQTESATSSP